MPMLTRTQYNKIMDVDGLSKKEADQLKQEIFDMRQKWAELEARKKQGLPPDVTEHELEGQIMRSRLNRRWPPFRTRMLQTCLKDQ